MFRTNSFGRPLFNEITCLDYMKEHYPMQYLETKIFNRLGKIPICSTASGLSRVCIGTAQIIYGLSRGCFFAYQLSIETKDSKGANGGIRHFRNLTYEHLETAVHGVCNVFRGLIESIPLAGNVFCYLYDPYCRIGYRQEIGKANLILHFQAEKNKYMYVWDKKNDYIGIESCILNTQNK